MIAETTYTTPSIIQELKGGNLFICRIESSIESGSLIVKEPSKSSLERIDRTCQLLGEQVELSEADRSLLALAYELKDKGYQPTILTDDFAIQNVSEYLGMNYKALATKGITKLLGWIIYCPACRKKFEDPGLKICRICGTLLKRKPVKSLQVKHKKDSALK